MSDRASVFLQHSRNFGEFRFIYPVVSRRARGVSVGVNLNPDKVCNFDCVYCQVDRRSPGNKAFVEMEQLRAELLAAIQLVQTGALFEHPTFAATPLPLRRLNDIAFSGDGEPTTFANFDAVIQLAADIRRAESLDDVKLVLITNASMFHREVVQRGLAILDENNGEIWAKLDAGTPEFFAKVARTRIPFERILENITQAAQIRPIVIQSLFMRWLGSPPEEAEIEAYCMRLNEITRRGGHIKGIQIYTVARPPAESFISPLNKDEIDAIASRVAEKTGLAVATFL
ncbi:MAG TPA: radical SAM protein [Thermogutta sp.]|nr:radical SAM protein [Thermogutta sp.]